MAEQYGLPPDQRPSPPVEPGDERTRADYSTRSYGPGERRSGSGAASALWLVGLFLVAVAFIGGLILGDRGLLQGAAGAPTASGPVTSPTFAAEREPSAPARPTAPAARPTEPSAPTPGGAVPASPGNAGNATPPAATPVPPPTLAPITPPPGPTPTQPPDAPADFGLFWEALQIIRQHFVGRDELDDRELTYGAIRGLVDALGDTGHSVFLTPEALQREQESLSGTIVGIGALLGESAGRPVIVSVISGAPADRAGLRSGDILVSVDGTDVAQMPPEEIVTHVRGEEGTTVEIVVERPETGEELTFSIVREEIRIPTATWAMVPGTNVAVLRLIQFSDGAADQLRAARDEALAEGAEAFILDLRSNPGGFVHEAVRITSQFIDDRTVYIRELADGERVPVDTCRPVDGPNRPDFCRPIDSEPPTQLPVVVLIDEGTASSAEIVAGALRSAGRAELVGETTFGTGTVLLTYQLSDGSAVRIAVERWLTPDGELIFGQGIEPTIVVESGPTDFAVEPDELRELSPDELPDIADPQLLRAIELLTGRSLTSPPPSPTP